MNKRQRIASALILLVIALGSALMIGYVLEKEKPQNIDAFQNRFASLAELGLEADGAVLTVDGTKAAAAWEACDGEIIIRTAAVPVAASKKVLVNATVGGLQNASKTERWNYQLWMELTTFRDGQTVGTSAIELPLENGKGRGRVYAVQVDGAADSYQVCLRVTPLDGKIVSGGLDLSKWEVYAE